MLILIVENNVTLGFVCDCNENTISNQLAPSLASSRHIDNFTASIYCFDVPQLCTVSSLFIHHHIKYNCFKTYSVRLKLLAKIVSSLVQAQWRHYYKGNNCQLYDQGNNSFRCWTGINFGGSEQPPKSRQGNTSLLWRKLWWVLLWKCQV